MFKKLSLKKALQFWNKYSWDSIDDDDIDDDNEEYLNPSLPKRARWNTKPISHKNMALEGSRTASTSKPLERNLATSGSSLNTGAKENFYDLTSDDDNDIEIITPIRNDSRPPLSPLPTRHRVHSGKPHRKEHPSSTPLEQNGGAIARYHNNGRVSSHLRLNKSGSLTSRRNASGSEAKHTALNESIRLDEKRKYSMMLDSFLKSGFGPRNILPKTEPPKMSRDTQTSPLSIRLRNRRYPSVHMIDLTKEEDAHIPIQVKDSPKVVSNQQERKTIQRVNSFEEKLKSINFVGPQWITEMQQKYGAREREKRREINDALLVKDLYGKHNKIFCNALTERLQKHLAITEVILDEKEDVPALPTLTPEMEQRVKEAFIPNPSGEVVAEGFGQRITRKDIYTLSKLNWLNDEVINFYMNLLIERGKVDNLPSIYAFNTFFYPKLASVGHSALKRWTKKVDVFAQSMLIVPVHLGMHWCLAVIDFRDKTVKYYDSMGGSNNKCLNALLQYLKDESLDKKKQPFDVSGWKLENVKDIPQQMNGSDCGMFSCMFAEFISRNADITFSQDDMPYFRKKMAYEIITKNLLT